MGCFEQVVLKVPPAEMCDLCWEAALEAGICLQVSMWVGLIGDPVTERNKITMSPVYDWDCISRDSRESGLIDSRDH